MIVQACLNGARTPAFHPAPPLTAGAMAQDALACIAAGAAGLHGHPRGPDGRESLTAAAMHPTLLALDRAGIRRPVLPHGTDATVWPWVTLAFARRCSTRVGREDGAALPDGTTAAGNPALVAATVAAFPTAAHGDGGFEQRSVDIRTLLGRA